MSEINLKIKTDMTELRELLEEVEFLRYFYNVVEDYDWDYGTEVIRNNIATAFVAQGGKLPLGYGDEE